MALPISRGRKERRVTDGQHDRFADQRQCHAARGAAVPDRIGKISLIGRELFPIDGLGIAASGPG